MAAKDATTGDTVDLEKAAIGSPPRISEAVSACPLSARKYREEK